MLEASARQHTDLVEELQRENERLKTAAHENGMAAVRMVQERDALAERVRVTEAKLSVEVAHHEDTLGSLRKVNAALQSERATRERAEKRVESFREHCRVRHNYAMSEPDEDPDHGF